VANCPDSSKYTVCDTPNVIWYFPDVVAAFGVARISAITAATIFAPPVCDVALRFVCTPTGSKPKTAIKQNATIPIAIVTSISEKAATKGNFLIIAYKS
jgi:hypothetical protein